jgi:hypothetical protein
MKPENFAEKAIWYTLLWTYGYFIIGGLYVVGCVIGWVIFGYWLKTLYFQTSETPEEDKIRIPIAVWVWIIGMLMQEVALIMGHLDFFLDLGAIIKSTIGWAKGWALLALFPLLGTLKIRPQLLYRIACIIGLQTLIVFPLFYLAYLAKIPPTPYVSPLRLVGGPGPEFFAPNFYEIDPENLTPRWRLFTPWAPALGFMGNIYFFLSIQEKNLRWRLVGMIGAVFMCYVSVSRLAQLSIPIVAGITYLCSSFGRPAALLVMSVASTILGIIAPKVIDAYVAFDESFKAARAGSSRVRAALKRIGIDRWQNEAPIWGHGIVEPGPHMVEFMPIGSHHTWVGLLFVKGIVGLLSLAIPMAWSFIDLVLKSQTSKTAQTGLNMLVILFLYTFGENLEILVYLTYPAFLMLGIALKEPIQLAKLIGKNDETKNYSSVG